MRFTKPRKFTPQNPQKYIGDANNIISRSNLETHFFQKIDNNSNILSWGSEEIIVPYISAVDNKTHRYFPDLFLKVKTKNGQIKKFLVEIKPRVFCESPRLPKSKRRTKGYLQEVKNYIINQSKWKYATEFAKKHGMEFIIMTEKDL